MKKDSAIIIKDPLYKQILLDTKHKKYLDSKEFQRLRNIKQTSFSHYVYPSATHSRFTHSLGVCHLMGKLLRNGLNEVDSKNKDDLLLAALLHDIGHGPFSHIWELVFPHFSHEESTIKILEKFGLNSVIDIIEEKNKFSKLLSSTIDVDKLDYMARDSYFTGVSYGVAEVDFIIQHMYVNDGKMYIKPSCISSVEDLITQRVNLFKTVYFHKVAIMYDFILFSIFDRIKVLLKDGKDVWMDENLRPFFYRKDTVENLLQLDDILMVYHIKIWSNSKDSILKDLATSFLHRKKLKIINLQHQKVDIRKIKKEIAKKYDLNYYFKHVEIPIRILQDDIYVDFKDGKKEKLEKHSELIKFYKKQKWSVEFLICPKDIKI